MIDEAALMTVDIALPAIAGVLELASGANISERHHTHHDTYSVSRVMPRTLVLVMVFMGVLGMLTGWLCQVGVFTADPMVPLAFFASFQIVVFALTVSVTCYQVMAYEDRLLVRKTFGLSRLVHYDQIVRMCWIPSLLGPELKDLRICVRDGYSVRVWCLIDIEQLLLRINRFEVLEH